MVWGAAAAVAAPFIAQGVSKLFESKKKKPKKVSTLDRRQRELYAQNMASLRGQGPFSDLYNFNAEKANDNFDQNFSRPAYRQFEENVIPKITGQFRQGNIMNSSYTGESLGRAGRDVQEGLDAQRANMIYQGEQDARSNKINAIDRALNMQTFAYDKGQQPRSNNGIDNILNSLAPVAGDWFADYLNKPKNSQIARYNQSTNNAIMQNSTSARY